MASVPTEFTPYASLLGGGLIGLSAVMVMLLLGRIAGITGVVVQAMRLPSHRSLTDWGWRVAFLLGLVTAPLSYQLATGSPAGQTVSDDLFIMAAAGLLVGFGTAFGSGCTSGHGVCGLARLSPRSLVSVVVFMMTAAITVAAVRHAVGAF